MVVGYDPSGTNDGTSVLMSIVAGGLSASVSRSLINPFDVLKIRIQLLPRDINYGISEMVRTMIKKEGVAVFWKGHIPAQLMSVSHGVAQFSTYELLSKWTGSYEPHAKYLPAIDFTCGCVAGAAGTVFSNPADVVRTRVVGFPGIKYRGLFPTAMDIYRKEGVKAFFRGTVPGVLSRAPLAGLQFSFYRISVELYESLTDSMPGVPAQSSYLFSGALAGFIAESTIYPLDTIRKRQMIQGQRFVQTDCIAIWSCAKSIYSHGGIRPFYRGFTIAALKSAICIALQFTIYEELT
ncbi:mitochondrial thiamine pyrophosphate carrier-like [Ctenocephalides felis]|uniref:mitochondrial thiamine pyrophosphate carrier-like n=1 Tax=Ctenocephalides felis TaxID=7515 RepID=UPI000E6E2F5B|nr:mitochondrial thiamine pyrophosphate carrier-like [Ctenocephalides felis]